MKLFTTIPAALLAFKAVTSRLFWQVCVMLLVLFIVVLYQKSH